MLGDRRQKHVAWGDIPFPRTKPVHGRRIVVFSVVMPLVVGDCSFKTPQLFLSWLHFCYQGFALRTDSECVTNQYITLLGLVDISYVCIYYVTSCTSRFYSRAHGPLLVLKARHLSGSAFCTAFSRLEVPEQALDGIPLGLGSVVKINLLNFHVY